MKLRLSCDDGCASDMRVLELAQKHGIDDLTFYIPANWHSFAFKKGFQPLKYKDLHTLSKNAEIGAHGVTHSYLTRMDYEMATREIAESKLMLENLLNIQIRRFCPPRGYTDEDLDAFIYHWYDSRRLTTGLDSDGYKLVHVHPDSGVNDNKKWQKCTEYALDDKVHLWFHSWELDRFDMWNELDEFLEEQT